MIVIQDPENPNQRILQKCVNGNLETWRETESSTEISEQNGNVIIETITKTRTLLTTTTTA